MVTIGHAAAEGRIGGCGRTIELKPLPPSWPASVFGRLGAPLYLLDLRGAPAGATWLRQTNELWNGQGAVSMAIADAFDVLMFSKTLTPACGAPSAGSEAIQPVQAPL